MAYPYERLSRELVIDKLEDADGWAAMPGTVATNLATNSTDYHVFHGGSVEFDKAADASIDDAAVLKTLSEAIDASAFGPGDKLVVAVYLDSIADMAELRVTLGSDSSNRTEWVLTSGFVAGWHTYEIDLVEDWSANAGNGWSPGSVSVIALAVQLTSAGASLTGIRWSHLAFRTVQQT